MKRSLLSALIGVACLATTAGSAAWAAPEKPNIVYIIVDDQRYDAMGFVNSDAVTPNMDAMAKDGTYFKNAFVTTSLCGPSRASILTGMYAHNHGMVDNNKNDKVYDLNFFPQRLKEAGYQTGFFGKWHFGGVEKEAKPGFAGFDKWVGFIGSNSQGNYYPVNEFGGASELNVDGKVVKQKGYITDELTDYAVDWLDHRDKSKPFMLYLGHKGVHADFLPAPRHIGKLKGKVFKKPDSWVNNAENYQGKPRWVKDQRNSWHGIDFPYMEKLDYNEWLQSYYETLMSVDESVGRVRQYLKEHNLDKNTIIMVMGDNGFMFGEHGLIDKRNAYEESIRVPLIASGPGFDAGRVVDDVVANIDIAPTLLEAAGLPKPKDYDGSSFLSLGSGKAPAEPRSKTFVYEYFWEYNFPYTPTTFAIRGEQYKYINYYGVWDTEELYDLKADPKEMHNLINSTDPQIVKVKQDLRQELFAKLGDHNGENIIPYNAKLSEGIVQRYEDKGNGVKSADFPQNWMRPYGPKDKYVGFLPDTPGKAERLQKMSEAMDKTQDFIKENYMKEAK
ncbi:sulfatase [Atlantibacter sp. RC6]|uniref:sulfatase family protein n=1 Tax=Atlantibacter sp. RC6 TaxID=2587036 RepID=UPI0016060847|nr:sulfatase [Atlantibacter sp. RC6]MBB3324567.1 arylsulfatase A-like enzyme [Atlantibacter sp. RC6]